MYRTNSFFRSPLFPIFMIVFVDILGFAITIPVLPLFVQNEFGGTVLQVTSLSTIFFAAQFLATPQLGRLSDRIGRRPVLIISQFGSLLALLLSGLSPNLVSLYLARLIDGLTGGNIAVAQAYLSDTTNEQNRTSSLGIVNAAMNTSFLIGPAFGGIVAAHFGPRVPFFMAAFIAFLTILLSYKLLPEPTKPQYSKYVTDNRSNEPTTRHSLSPKKKRDLIILLSLPGMLLMMFIALGDRIAFFIYQPTWVLWAESVLLDGYDLAFVQQTVGLMLTLIGAAGIISQIWLVKLFTKISGEKQMVIWGTIMRGFAWITMAVFPFLMPTILVAPLIGIGGGIALPALTALITYATPPEQQGYAIGILHASKSIGRIIGSIVGGIIFQFINPSATLGAAAVISALLLIAIFNLPMRDRTIHAEMPKEVPAA